jgi:predicted nucleic acid-binding Zn ribbon protein
MSANKGQAPRRRSAGTGRGPRAIGDVLAELMARQGFARIQSSVAFEAAWREAAGELASRYSRPGRVRRGKLEVTVANSTVVQELTFRKPALLESLSGLLPELTINDIRFRVGSID